MPRLQWRPCCFIRSHCLKNRNCTVEMSQSLHTSWGMCGTQNQFKHLNLSLLNHALSYTQGCKMAIKQICPILPKFTQTQSIEWLESLAPTSKFQSIKLKELNSANYRMCAIVSVNRYINWYMTTFIRLLILNFSQWLSHSGRFPLNRCTITLTLFVMTPSP